MSKISAEAKKHDFPDEHGHVHNIVLTFNPLSDKQSTALVDSDWYDELAKLCAAAPGGLSMGARELLAAYDPMSPGHRQKVLVKLHEQFEFEDPS
ncbi:MAG TPA: hypothetical protein VD907_02435 [Verrucomicrobiae bacterium]|nr:hypothetical protein [Verrucomicrobiae bacterium]